MRKLNPEHIEEVKGLINNAPYFQLLSIAVEEIGEEFARMKSDVKRKHLTPFGGIHGGAYASMLDSAAYWAAYSSIDENAGMTTLDLNVNNLAPVQGGELTILGRLIKAGRSICLAEAFIRNPAGKLIAHATSKMMVVPGMQTIEQAALFGGGRTLPPKFIKG